MKIFKDIKLLWPHISETRRLHLLWLLGLMMLGAVAELVSLGAVVPFIAVLSDPNKVLEQESTLAMLRYVDVEPEQIGIVVSIVFALLVGLATGIRLVLLWASNKVVFKIGFDLGVGVFSKTLHRPYSWHVSRNSSEVLGGLNKAQIVVQGYLLPLLNAAVAIVLASGMVIMLIYVDPFAALAGAGAFGLCYFAMALGVRKRVAANGKKIARANNKRVQEMQEGIGGIRDVILDSSQAIYVKRFSEIDGEMREAQANNTFLANSPRLAIEGLGLIIIAGFALVAAKKGNLTDLLPVLGALGLGAQKLMPLIQTIYTGWNATTANRQALHDVLELLDMSEDNSKPASIYLEKALTLSNVSYFYPSSPENPALDNINIEIKKGQVVGIVGKTGGGKSTLVDLLMGLVPASFGDFFVDGVSLDNHEKLRGWSYGIAHVPQTIFLADCSIEQNIALGVDPDLIDKRRLLEAARAAEIHDFIIDLPEGYKTEVGERGVRLSGGQRQRIGIARALYRKAQFLVLDEATSALDDETEKQVIDNIHYNFPDLTIVMVAHRLSTLQRCDFILEMSCGKIERLLPYKDLII